MKKPRRAKFTIEIERTFIFRNFGGQQLGWCVGCGAEASLATVAGAAREFGLSELAIYQLLDTRAIHFREDAEGRILVGLNSLLK